MPLKKMRCRANLLPSMLLLRGGPGFGTSAPLLLTTSSIALHPKIPCKRQVPCELPRVSENSGGGQIPPAYPVVK